MDSFEIAPSILLVVTSSPHTGNAAWAEPNKNSEPITTSDSEIATIYAFSSSSGRLSIKEDVSITVILDPVFPDQIFGTLQSDK